MLNKLRLRLRALFFKSRLEEELDEEVRFHLEREIEENIARGMSPEEARMAALRSFGGVERVKEESRDERGVRFLEEVWQDLRYGARMMLKHRGFTAVAVLTLALGIGANTAIFSVLNALLLRSLPVKDPDELALLANVSRAGLGASFSYPLYEQLRDGSHSLSGLFAAGAISKRRLNAGGTEPEFIRAQEVTGNFFSVLGVPALLGRTLTHEDDQASHPQRVMVISHSFWQRRFGADPAIVGKTITFEDVPMTIVGVTPPGFFGFQPGEHPDLWWPMQMIQQVVPGQSKLRLKDQGTWWLQLMGRLPAGVDRTQAQAELNLIFQRHMAEFEAPRASSWSEWDRRTFSGRKLEAHPGATGHTELRGQLRRSLLLLMTSVGLVLLIACANVASLLLARAAARQREFTVRSALGAGRLRLVRQLLIESLLLAALGGLLGLLLSQAGTRAMLVFMRIQDDPVSFNVAPDARVLLFTLASSLLTGLIFGIAPALRSSRLDLASAIKGAGGSVAGDAPRQRLNQALVVAQVALSLVLLVGAGLFVRTLAKLKATDAGFNRENVVVFDLDFTQRLDTTRRVTLYKELLARLETLPGARAASMSSFFLLGQCCSFQSVTAEGYAARPGENLYCNEFRVSPRFFETTGTSLLSGRDFGPQDETHSSNANASRAAVINQAMAQRYFGDANPVGRRFYSTDQPEQKFEIVGVVKDVRYRSLREPSPPAYYLPFFQNPGNMGMTFALRTTSDSGTLAASLRQVVRDVDPTVQTRDVRSLNDVVNTALRQERVLTQLCGFFSLFALAITCLGLYGVLSFSVVQRTREIGVRIALGAQGKNVLALVVSQGLKLALSGLTLGLAAAFAVTRFVSNLLYGVTPTDPVTFIGISLLLLLVAVLASCLPARRATKLDPMTVLRHD
jgi:predicted permease